MKTTVRMLLEKQQDTIHVLMGSVIWLIVASLLLLYMLITK